MVLPQDTACLTIRNCKVMKNLDLKSCGVVEMSNTEMKRTAGGFAWLIIVAAIAFLAGDLAQDGKVDGAIYL